MLTPDKLHDYQKRMVNHQCSHPNSMIWADVGLGKTAVTLTSLVHLLNTKFLKGVIVVAPVRVIKLVWKQEAAKWEHTKHLRFSTVVGTKDQRTRALLRPADIYLINYENLGWLAEMLQTYFLKKDLPLPMDGLVWDEVSKCKNSNTQRVKSVKKILEHFKWTTGLTGTPASNGYKDLHGQYLVVDKGQRLGVFKTQFKTRFYKKVGPFKEVALEGAEEQIKHLVGDITLEMSAADYNPLPDLIVNNVDIELPPTMRTMYNKMEKEFFLTLDSGTGIEVFNAASLTNKCLAGDTEVLTTDGWVRIDQYSGQMVWDGVEWVSTSGLLDQGYKSVIECWGVSMTPDHRVLTNSGWITAKEITDGQSSKRYDRFSVRLPDDYTESGEQGHIRDLGTRNMGGRMRLRKDCNASGSESKEFKQKENEVLRLPPWRNDPNPRNDKDTAMDNMAEHDIKMYSGIRQGLDKLRRAWNNCLRQMVKFSGFLGRHASRIPRSFHNREERCRWLLRQVELQMGGSTETSKQYKKVSIYSNTTGCNNSNAGSTKVWNQTNHNVQTYRTGVDGSEIDNTTKVFDIVNAGPRHRFTVRGKNGEIFISHNCLQFSNGAMYPIAGAPAWEPIHDLKLEALEDILDELQGNPVLCSYAYRSDAERIMARFKKLNPINLTECKSEKLLMSAMDRWKKGDCALMIGHPASMGHGIDGLQQRGHHLVWFGLNWSLELYEQFNGRLRRQGQGVPVTCHRIMCRDTLDQAQALALDEKAQNQAGLRNAIKSYRSQRENYHGP